MNKNTVDLLNGVSNTSENIKKHLTSIVDAFRESIFALVVWAPSNWALEEKTRNQVSLKTYPTCVPNGNYSNQLTQEDGNRLNGVSEAHKDFSINAQCEELRLLDFDNYSPIEFSQEDEERLNELLKINEDDLTATQWDELGFLAFNEVRSIQFTQEDEIKFYELLKDELLRVNENNLTDSQLDELESLLLFKFYIKKLQSIKFSQEDEKKLNELLSKESLTKNEKKEKRKLKKQKWEYLIAMTDAENARTVAYIAKLTDY